MGRHAARRVLVQRVSACISIEKAKIRVKDVDMMLKNIDFELVEDDDYEQSEDGWN